MIRKISYILAALFLTGASALAATTADSLTVMLKDSVVLAQKPDGHRDTLARKVERKYTDIYLDTVTINVKNYINDYSMVGVQYGVSLNQMMFNPTKKQKMQFNPINVGIVYTKYGKMFGYMPYFGFQTGFFYGKEGYEFKKDKKTGEYTESVDGATSATYEYIEVPLLAHMHMDVWHLKFIVNGGLFGGYRMSVERQGSLSDDKYLTTFYDYDRRFEYGVKAGVGLGLFFDPIEFHITAMARYSLGSLYKPDYNSEYYYRFAYPFDIIISGGIHIQLTRRTGKTKSQLKKEAKELIYETGIENIGGKGR